MRKKQLIEVLNAEMALNDVLAKMRIGSVKYFCLENEDEEDYMEQFNCIIDKVEEATNLLDDMREMLLTDVRDEDEPA